MAETTYNVGIYCRLSNDDERVGESLSIENQRLLLQQYVRDQGWNEIDTYIDDGYSGTNFDRPGVQDPPSPGQRSFQVWPKLHRVWPVH